jgi:hypothetical protein
MPVRCRRRRGGRAVRAARFFTAGAAHRAIPRATGRPHHFLRIFVDANNALKAQTSGEDAWFGYDSLR